MKVFQTDVKLYATMYILAETAEEAEATARASIHNGSLQFSDRPDDVGDGIVMTGEAFDHDMPDVSLSPVMSFAPLAEQDTTMGEAEDLGDAPESDDDDGEYDQGWADEE